MVDCLLFVFPAYLVFPFTSFLSSARLDRSHKNPFNAIIEQVGLKHIDRTPELPTMSTLIADRSNFITTGRVPHTAKELCRL
jgi:hypothetical protein